MTPESLDEAAVRARLEAATPGPWEAHHRRDLDWLSSAMVDNEGHEPGSKIVLPGDEGNPIWSSCWPGRNARSDAEFIAHARTDLPAALDEITRLRAALDEARAEVEHWRGMHDDATAQLRLSIRETTEARAKCAGLSDLAAEKNARAEKAEAEQAYTYGLARKAHARAVAAESALEAVRADAFSEDAQAVLFGVTGTHPETYGGVTKDEALECAGEVLTRIRAALATPTTPEETQP